MDERPPTRFQLLRKHEMRINLLLALASLFMVSVGLVLRSNITVGISLLLLVFFSTYTIYGFVRRER
jgi:predicted proteasome-type protease